jgi:hypothetical protein
MLSGIAAAQHSDPALQTRLLKRSDGSIYVYKDGAHYPVLL